MTSKGTVYVITYSPSGERALVTAHSRAHVAALADDIAREHKIVTSGSDCTPAEADDLTAKARKGYVNLT